MSFFLANIQDIILFIPLKVLILHIYLPTLMSKNVSRTKAGLTRVQHWYGKLVNENATVYVTLKHPELESSELVLDAFSHVEVENKVDMGGDMVVYGTNKMESLKFNSTTPAARRSIWNLGLGSPATRSRSESASFMTDEVDESEFKYKGLRKCGIITFAGFVMLPSIVQDLLLYFFIPILPAY